MSHLLTEEQRTAMLYYLLRFSKEIHNTAVDKGWWEKPRSGAECIALMHSELSEALEAQRKTKTGVQWTYSDDGSRVTKAEEVTNRPADKHLPHLPNEAVELADCIIRILDYATYAKLPVVEAMIDKAEYNTGREYKHGKEF